jgi:uncharacterized protein YjgD (DUF1641 family)
MAQPIEFKPVPSTPADAARRKLESAPAEHAEALLKAYALLDTANRHGILDLLRGAISAEDTILDKVAGYANTPEGIATMRNLLVLGKLLGAVDPGVLGTGASDLTAKIVAESKKPPSGIFAITRRLFGGDALRGLALGIAALESIGKTARLAAQKRGAEK